MVSQKYRWDFIGLSTDTKPTSETSDKVVNGSTYYCSDTSKLYVYCNGTWYERKPLGGGGGGGGTSDFNDLSNRPKYNGSNMTGSTNIPEVKTYTAGSNVSISNKNVISATDTTYSSFTGTDGTTAGAAGLVPAPATTDAGKFLKADGTWDVAGGGGAEFIELTTADYNWNRSTGQTGTPNCVALWLLPSGIYKGPASTSIEVRATRTQDYSMGAGFSSYAIVKECENTNTNRAIVTYVDGANGNVVEYYSIDENGQNYSTKNFPNVVQTIGSSTTDVMSQNAVSSMIFADPGTNNKIVIGTGANVSEQNYNMAIGVNADANGVSGTAVGYGAKARPNGTALGYNAQAGTTSSQTNTIAIGQSAYGGGDHCTTVGDNSNTANSYSTAIGTNARARSERSVAIGASAEVDNSPAMAYSVALGANAITTRAGEVNVGTGSNNFGYNSTPYRVIGGVHDGLSAHDAATVGQITPLSDSSAPTTATVGRLGQIFIDTTTATAYMCVAVDTVTPAYTWKQITA